MHILENNITLNNNDSFQALKDFVKMTEDELSELILETLKPMLTADDDYNFSIGFLLDEEELNDVRFIVELFGHYGDHGHIKLELIRGIYFERYKEEEEEEGTLMSEKEYAGMKLTSNKL